MSSKVTKQRNRIPLSCSNCRKKKIKCDRNKPVCTICIAHGTADTCNYYTKSGELTTQSFRPLPKSTAPAAPAAPATATATPSSAASASASTLVFASASASTSTVTPTSDSVSILPKELLIAELKAQITELKEKLHRLNNLSSPASPSPSPSSSSSPPTSTSPSNKKPARTVSPLITYGGPLNDYETLSLYIKTHLTSYNVDIHSKLNIYSSKRHNAIHGQQKSLILNSGPFSWLSIISRDPLANPIKDAVLLAKRDILAKFQQSALQKSLGHNSELMDLHSPTADGKMDKLLNQNKTLEICKNILKFLPNKRVIWLFIDRFFKYLYPFMPYLDEDFFIADIERILKTNRRNDLNSNFEINITSLSLTEYPDLAIIGTLLVVLKFSYESLFSIDGSFVENKNERDHESYLVKFNQRDILIQYANQCLNQYLLLKKSPLPALQCAILFREYQNFNGSEAFIDTDLYIYTGLLIQIATTLGLNKEPPAFPNDLYTLKLNQLKRKIWYGLVSADITQYTQFGIPPVVDAKFFNTRLPEYDKKVKNVDDKLLEKVTCKMLVMKFEVESTMKKLADCVIDMKNPPTFGEVVYRVITLENELRSRFESFNSLLRSEHQGDHYKKIEKVQKFTVYINALSFLLPIYIISHYHFSELENFESTFFLYNKMMSFWMFILGNLKDLVESPHIFFDHGFEIVLAPLIEVIITKTCMLPTTSIIRFYKAANKIEHSNPKLHKALKTFINERLMYYTTTIFTPTLQILSKRYFYAWKIYKIHLFIFDMLNKGTLKIESDQDDKVFNFVERLTVEDIEQLSVMMDHRYFSASITQPEWLDDWVKQMNDFIYDPKNHVNFDQLQNEELKNFYKNKTPTADTNNPNIPPETHDEKWFGKMYKKIAVPNTDFVINPIQPSPSGGFPSSSASASASASVSVSPLDCMSQPYVIPTSTVLPTSNPSVNINNTSMLNSYIFQSNQMNQLLNMNNINDLFQFYEPENWSPCTNISPGATNPNSTSNGSPNNNMGK